PDAAQDHRRLALVDVVDDQAVEAVDLDVLEGLRDLADHLDPLLFREKRLLRRVVAHRDDHLVEDLRAALDDVEVSVRDGIEAARVDGRAHGLPTLLYVKPSSRILAGSYTFLPSMTVGWAITFFILAQSRVRNSSHSVSRSAQSAPWAASSALEQN